MEIGDYVKTTYGIGKIENAYIVYDDGGNFWHLCYTTDNPKIEIGIYTKANSWELFGEIQKDHSIKYEPLNVYTQKYFDMVYKQKLEEPVCYVPVVNGMPRNAELFDDHKFIKSSPNIIDLIEENDLIEIEYKISTRENQKEIVQVIKNVNNKLFIKTYTEHYVFIENIEKTIYKIKGIITHEQIESMEYKVKE